MGKRGPKPGFKQARLAAQAAAGAAAAPVAKAPTRAKAARKAAAPVAPAATDDTAGAAQPGVCTEVALLPGLPAAHRENPDKLGGAALRHLAHRRGIARSEAERLPDDRLREQLRYRAYQQYAEA